MTLRANELRIGNIVNDPLGFGPMIVEAINPSPNRIYLRSMDGEYLGDFDIAKIEGIPLTEERLIRFGFEKRTDFNPNPHNIVFAWMNHAVMLIPAKGLYEYLFWWDGGNTTIKYAHQLQNLCFALRSEELPLANHPL